VEPAIGKTTSPRAREIILEQLPKIISEWRLEGTERLLASWEGAILRMKVERGPAPLDRFKNIAFQTIFKETRNREK
jgi:hypothetical protein